MTALPTSPGITPSLYQPISLVCPLGTSISPLLLTLIESTRAPSPIAGMLRCNGAEGVAGALACSDGAVGTGSVASACTGAAGKGASVAAAGEVGAGYTLPASEVRSETWG